MKAIFQYTDYKEYLNARLDLPPLGGRGARARLCKRLACQTSYLAQVLRGSAHLSLEQAELTSAFLDHADPEAECLMLLILLNRAGNPALKRRLGKQIAALREKQQILKNRLDVGQPLTAEDQAHYYSAWYFAAIHVVAGLPGCQTIEAIARHLRIGARETREAVEFLSRIGLLKVSPQGIAVGTTRIHLASDSPLIAKHHANWRLQAMHSFESPNPADFHYSSAVTVSKDDFIKIRERLLREITVIKPIIRDSQSEVSAALCFDLFEI